MLEKLINLFVGKIVCITHTNDLIPSSDGTCRNIHQTEHPNEFKIQLKDGRRFSFIPEMVSHDSVEGPLPYGTGGRRKIQVVKTDGETSAARSDEDGAVSIPSQNFDDNVTMQPVAEPFRGNDGRSGGAGASGSWSAPPEAESQTESPSESLSEPASTDMGDSGSSSDT